MIINPYVFAGKSSVLVDRTLGTNIGDMTSSGGLAAAFDGNTNQASASCARKSTSALGYVGKTLASPIIFSKAIVHGSNNLGYINIPGRTVVLSILGKQGSAPVGFSDGTQIGSISFAEGADESAGREITSTDLVTQWDHIWLRTQYAGGTPTPSDVRVAELILYEWA